VLDKDVHTPGVTPPKYIQRHTTLWTLSSGNLSMQITCRSGTEEATPWMILKRCRTGSLQAGMHALWHAT